MKVLDTTRTYLREFQTEDLERLSEIYSDEDVMKYIGKGGPLTKEQTEKGIEAWKVRYKENGFGIWGLILKENDLLIGHCGFNKLKENSEIEIAYLLAKEYWGKGLATEISKATLEYGFNEVKLERIVALAYPENSASINVIEKLGMKLECEKEFFGKTFSYFGIERAKIKTSKLRRLKVFTRSQ